jgi:hypothetical protein
MFMTSTSIFIREKRKLSHDAGPQAEPCTVERWQAKAD